METSPPKYISLGPADYKKGIKYSSDLARPDSLSTEVAPQQVLVMEQEVKALLEKGAIEYVPSLQQVNRVLQPVFHSSKEGCGVA